MAELYVHHEIQDSVQWRKVVDDLTTVRTQFGCTGHQVFRSPSDANEITILTDWHMPDQAKAYAMSNELKDRMKEADVISQPDVIFLAEALSLRAMHPKRRCIAGASLSIPDMTPAVVTKIPT